MTSQHVHVAITRRVREGSEAEFERLLKTFITRSLELPGSWGALVFRPPSGSEPREFGLMQSFIDEDAANQFYNSELFAQWLRDIEPLTEGEPVYRRLSGLEAFFRGGSAMPPRWKMAVVTFLGVLPVALFWSNLLTPLMSHMNWLLRGIAINAAIVVTLTWIAMPVLTRLFRPWLRPNS